MYPSTVPEYLQWKRGGRGRSNRRRAGCTGLSRWGLACANVCARPVRLQSSVLSIDCPPAIFDQMGS